jgi:hypothetical protein
MSTGRRNPRNTCHWSFWERLNRPLYFLGLSLILLIELKFIYLRIMWFQEVCFPGSIVWSSCYFKSMSWLLKTGHLASVVVAIVINKVYFDLLGIYFAYSCTESDSLCFGSCLAKGTWASLVFSESLTRKLASWQECFS